eukprot:403343541
MSNKQNLQKFVSGYSQIYTNNQPGTIAHKSNNQQQSYSNTNQFEIVLQRALEVQESMIGTSKNVQKVSKSTKTFKDIAESLISQMTYLQKNGRLSSASHPSPTMASKYKQQNPLKQKTSQQIEDEMEVATISTQMGNMFEEESNQLKELMREKDQMIDMLSKEKNYYIRRCEQQLKTIQSQPVSKQQTPQFTQQQLDQLNHLQQDMDMKIQALEEAQLTIRNQNEVIERQASYIQQFENTLGVLNIERDAYLKKLEELEADLHRLNQENSKLLGEIDCSKNELNERNSEIERLKSQKGNNFSREIGSSNNSNSNHNTGLQDLARVSQVQLQMFEQLVRENGQLNQQVKQLKQDPLMINEMGRSSFGIQSNSKVLEIVQDIFFSIPSQRKTFGVSSGSISIEDQLLDIKNFIDQKMSSQPQPLAISPNKMREPISISNHQQQQLQQQQNILPSSIKSDQKFCSLINVNLLDIIYKDFFQSQTSGYSASQDQIEQKNRCFKDVYNMLEDSVLKFYDIFVKYRASELKNQKLEETFIQLDTVFSNDQTENEDNKVLDELRNLNKNTLTQYFNLQKEFVEMQALDGISAQILKLLKKQSEKSSLANGNKSTHKQNEEVFTLEQQVIELKIKLQDYEKIIQKRERKQQKKHRQKSGGRSPGGCTTFGNENYDIDSSVHYNIRKSQQIKSLDRSINSSHNLGFQNGLRFGNIQNMNHNLSNNINTQANQELQQNLNKALDKLFEYEERVENLEKEKSVLQLDISMMKNDYDKVLSQQQIQEARYLEVTEQNLGLQDENQLMSSEMSSMKSKIDSLSKEIEECKEQLLHCEREIQEQSDKAKRLANLNEELRELITMERNAQNEEKLKQDENVEKCNTSWESKLKLVKNKLLMALQNEGYMTELRQSKQSKQSKQGSQFDQFNFDQVIKMACDAILKINNHTISKPNHPSSTQYSASHSRQISIGHSNQLYSVAKSINTNALINDISPVKPINDTKPYLSNGQNNMNDVSRVSDYQQTRDYSAHNYERFGDYNQYGTNNSKTPQKYIMLQPVEQSSIKKPPVMDQNQEFQVRQNPAHHFDTFNDFQEGKYNIDEDLQYLNTSFHNNGGYYVNNPYVNPKNDPKQNTQETDNLVNGLGMDFKSTQNSLNNFLHNTIQSQGPLPYQNLAFSQQRQIHKHHSSNDPNTQTSSVNIHQSASQKEFQVYSPQAVLKPSNKTPVQYSKLPFNLEIRKNPVNYDMNIQQEFEAYTPSKSSYNHQQVTKSNNEKSNLKSSQQQPLPSQNLLKSIEYNEGKNPKRNINDILNSFKKEKESFNDKLSQLKSKLEAVKSPEPTNLKCQAPNIDRASAQHSGKQDCFTSPNVENRRAKTLQKLKSNFTNQVENEYQVSKAQFMMVNNNQKDNGLSANGNYFNCQNNNIRQHNI